MTGVSFTRRYICHAFTGARRITKQSFTPLRKRGLLLNFCVSQTIVRKKMKGKSPLGVDIPHVEQPDFLSCK